MCSRGAGIPPARRLESGRQAATILFLLNLPLQFKAGAPRIRDMIHE